MIAYRSHLNRKLKDRAFREHFDEEKQLLELALRIHEVRENIGMSQATLARRAGITQQQLSRLESGSNCNVSTLLKVCHALHIRVSLKQEKQRASA